jgi:hypothetical protein
MCTIGIYNYTFIHFQISYWQVERVGWMCDAGEQVMYGWVGMSVECGDGVETDKM